MSTTSLSGSAIHASLVPKPARSIGDAHGAGDVRLVELQLGADVDEQRAGAAAPLDLARRERMRLDGLADQRAAVERDDVLEVRRLRAEVGERLLDELVLVVDAQDLVVRAARSRSSRRP